MLLCKINPRINRVWVVHERGEHEQIASTEWIPFCPVVGIVPSYLGYFLQQNLVRDYLAANASGVGGSLTRIKPSTINGFKFPLAPLAEQHRIVGRIEELLSQVDAGVAGLRSLRAKLRRYRAAVLKAACEGKLVPTEAELARAEGRDYEPADVLLQRILAERRARWEADQLAKMKAKGVEPKDDRWKAKYEEPAAADTSELAEMPEGWVWETLDRLSDGSKNALKAGPFGSALKKEYYTPFGYKVYGQEQVIRGNPWFGDYYINADHYQTLQSCKVTVGDVLISLVGTVGKVLILPEGIEPGIINPRLVKVSLHPVGMLAKYLKIFLESPSVRREFSHASHGGTMDILNLSLLRVLALPFPPRAEQERIVAEVEARLSVLDQMEAALRDNLKRADRLRQAILRDAFAGKLVLQDPNDEPASVLLERIRTERDAADATSTAARSKTRTPRTPKAEREAEAGTPRRRGRPRRADAVNTTQQETIAPTLFTAANDDDPNAERTAETTARTAVE